MVSPSKAAIADIRTEEVSASAASSSDGSGGGGAVVLSDDVLVSRGVLNSLMEHITRCEAAARHCCRISQQAANAFSDEAMTLSQAKLDLAAALQRF